MEKQAMTLDILQVMTELRAKHLGRNNRRAQTALDVKAAAWLWRMCESEHAERVLELGSGFSSWALRHWQQYAGTTRDQTPELWTVDDEARWLETTRLELEELGFSTENLAAFDDLLASDCDGHFDVVFVDLDNTGTRLRHAEAFVRWTKPGGLLVLDDWHMDHYRPPMTAALAALGVTVAPVLDTMDEWGRYLAVGRVGTSATRAAAPSVSVEET